MQSEQTAKNSLEYCLKSNSSIAYNVKSHFLVHVYTQGVPQGLILVTLMFEEKWTTCIAWQDFNLLPWLPPEKGWTQQFALITSFFSQYPCSMLNGWIASDWQPLICSYKEIDKMGPKIALNSLDAADLFRSHLKAVDSIDNYSK